MYERKLELFLSYLLFFWKTMALAKPTPKTIQINLENRQYMLLDKISNQWYAKTEKGIEMEKSLFPALKFSKENWRAFFEVKNYEFKYTDWNWTFAGNDSCYAALI